MSEKIEISAAEIEAMQQAMLNSKEEIVIEEGRMTLRTEGLVKKYGERTVANNVSINVKQGEIVGLLGPNGAGKTTTFYMTTGLIVPNAGRIFLDNEEITKDPVYRRAQKGVGYLPQEASVFRKMSVEGIPLPFELFCRRDLL